MTGTIARRCGGRSLATWIEVKRAVADAPHPDRAVAPRLGRQPLDRVEPVVRLGLGVLVERDAARRPGPADVDPAEGVAARARSTCRAPCRRCAASCPCRTGSSRGSPGSAPAPAAGRGQPQVRRQLDAVARGDPHVPARSRPRGGARWPGGRASRRGASSAESRGRRGPSDATARPVRRCRRWTTRRRAPIERAVDPPLAARRLREPLDHRLARRGDPPGRRTRDLRRRPLREPGGRRPRLDDDDRVLLVGQHRYTLDAYSWEIPEGGVPDGERRSTAPGASCARRPASRPPTGASSPASTSRTPSRDEPAVLFVATGLLVGRGQPRRDRGARRPLAAVRRGPGDDPRRPDHRRDDGRRRRAGWRSSAPPIPPQADRLRRSTGVRTAQSDRILDDASDLEHFSGFRGGVRANEVVSAVGPQVERRPDVALLQGQPASVAPDPECAAHELVAQDRGDPPGEIRSSR